MPDPALLPRPAADSCPSRSYYVCPLPECKWSGSSRSRHAKSRRDCSAVPIAFLYQPGADVWEMVRVALNSQEVLTSASQEAAAAIDAAYEVMHQGLRGKDPYFNADLERAQVTFKHALRNLRRSYPGQFCGIAESDHNAIIGWTVRLAAFGISIPAAVAAARRVNFNMAGAVAEVAPQIEATRAAQEGRICA